MIRLHTHTYIYVDGGCARSLAMRNASGANTRLGPKLGKDLAISLSIWECSGLEQDPGAAVGNQLSGCCKKRGFIVIGFGCGGWTCRRGQNRRSLLLPGLRAVIFHEAQAAAAARLR